MIAQPSKKLNYLFTSESVSEGHPDKVADQISDTVLDNLLAWDPSSKVACETLVTTGQVVLAGEITTKADVELREAVRATIKRIGYTKAEYMFDGSSCGIFSAIHAQSPDINRGVERQKPEEQGAGDQGMMFGYANDDTPEYMPLPVSLAHKLTMKLAEVRKADPNSILSPDGKSQVTVEYDGPTPKRIDTVVISTQHKEEATEAQIHELVKEQVIKTVIPAELMDENTKIFINPTGRFVLGGPAGDTGLTGRKIIVDTYGGFGRHGGGCFSGKDPTKVDRSAAYAARHIAKNVVASGLAKECEVQIAYAIGVARPVSVMIDTFGTGTIDDTKISEIVNKVCDLRPAAIIRDLDLRRPIYKKTAAYGHFGREDADFTWEHLDLVDKFREEASKL